MAQVNLEEVRITLQMNLEKMAKIRDELSELLDDISNAHTAADCVVENLIGAIDALTDIC